MAYDSGIRYDVRRAMRRAMAEDGPPETATQLAERVAQYLDDDAHELGADLWCDDPDHFVWEIAAEFFAD